MFQILWSLFILVQGIAATPLGTVTGTLRTEAGLPAAGIRVAARAVEPQDTPALIGLDETDEAGRFVLENVPPGRYYIVAGRVDQPTFYPGTLGAASATVITVGPFEGVTGIDFTLSTSSLSPAPPQPVVAIRNIALPIALVVEGGGSLPVLPGTLEPTIQLVNKSGVMGPSAALSSSEIRMQLVQGVVEEYRVQVNNLPAGYVVKSAMFRSKDLTRESFAFSPATLLVNTLRIPTFAGSGPLQEAVDRAIRQSIEIPERLTVTIGAAP